jgi:uncharacterized membrane protein
LEGPESGLQFHNIIGLQYWIGGKRFLWVVVEEASRGREIVSGKKPWN